ncbi:hypothetical protein J3R82DRAFT_9681 [Butyriboletus roseoflavus]|nr:hypothetical protein J3R82DRAFT_9681 [Butyriboletus roseoflavus]
MLVNRVAPRYDSTVKMNTVEDPLYLLSIVETITDSLHDKSSASVHDLLDAYATFANRVRSQSQVLEACDTLLPALTPFKIHKDTFIRALRRDVRLAHVDPLSTLSRPRLSLDDTSLGNSILNTSVDAKQYARILPQHDLSILYGDVLDIALAEQLPVLNEAKTHTLSLWTLGSHRLPLNVLGSRRDDIFSALQRCLDGARQPGNIILDGLKAISHAIEHHPSEFFDLLVPLLPHVMKNLHCESSQLRLHASIALGKFANALVHEADLSLTKWQTLSNHITSYLDSCCGESQVAQGDTNFSRIVRAAFSPESHACPTVAPTWILAVLASFIVICGPALYRKPTVLRFILQALAMALTHKRSIVRALHPHVWRCFVWTFSQMLLNSEDVEPALISSAFYVIKQEVSGGIGMALANVLLSDRVTAIRSDERGDRVSQALLAIKAMVRTECKHTRREGFMFLQAFTNVAKVQYQILQSMYEIPASVLLNGAIIGAKWDSLPSIIHSIPKIPVSAHWLEDAEIARQYKTLLVIWKHYATKVDKIDLDSGLVDVWLSILLACSHQLERGQHITATRDVPRYTAGIIVEFLPSVADYQPEWGSWNVRDQLCSLTFIDQLWSAMRKAFVSLSLAEAAELILASILKYAFHVLDPGVRTLWGRLCANLMTTASPSFLRDVHDLKTSQLVIRSQRELWGVVATSLSPPELGLHWKELVNFLAFPIWYIVFLSSRAHS